MRTTSEREFLCNTIEECHRLKTADELRAVMESRISTLIPHTMSVCGIGNVETRKNLLCLNFGCPPKILAAMTPTYCLSNNVLFPLWKQKRAPQYAALLQIRDADLTADQQQWRDLLISCGITNFAMHGVVDVAGGYASFFYLCALPTPMNAQRSMTFEILVPHLHHALLGIAQQEAGLRTAEPGRHRAVVGPAAAKSGGKGDWPLTTREREVLGWVARGKTNPEIAIILDISEMTVRNHVHNVMSKLGANNRTQAVVKALQNNIVMDPFISTELSSASGER